MKLSFPLSAYAFLCAVSAIGLGSKAVHAAGQSNLRGGGGSEISADFDEDHRALTTTTAPYKATKVRGWLV